MPIPSVLKLSAREGVSFSRTIEVYEDDGATPHDLSVYTSLRFVVESLDEVGTDVDLVEVTPTVAGASNEEAVVTIASGSLPPPGSYTWLLEAESAGAWTPLLNGAFLVKSRDGEFTYVPYQMGDGTRTGEVSEVRFLLADTDPEYHLLVDEEIVWLISTSSSTTDAAGRGARQLAMQFTRKATRKEIGRAAIWYGDKARDFTALASELEARAAQSSAPRVWGGGVKDADRTQDTALVEPRFFRGQFRNAEASGVIDRDP